MRTVVDALLSPFEAVSIAEWRSTTLTSLRTLFDAPKGFLYTPQLGTVDVHIDDQGVDPLQMEEYFRDWVAEDLSQVNILFECGVSVATRETMWYDTGWTYSKIEAYARSAIWNDYHKRWGMLEGTGYFVTHQPAPGAIFLHSGFWVTGERSTNTMFFQEGFDVATALAPAFDAGIKLATLRAQLSGSIPTWIDELPSPLAVLDARGRTLHRNRAWLRTVAKHSASAIDTAARTMARTVLHGQLKGTRRSLPPTQAAIADVVLTATPLTLPGLPDTFVLLLLEDKSPPPVDYHAHALQLGLPPRLAEVAALVATGHSNAEIAAALHIRPSTARRQTERVLERLGVARRAGVAARLVSHG